MKSIFIKERIKLTQTLIILVIIHLCMSVYFILNMRNWFVTASATDVWNNIITRNIIFFNDFELLLLATGLALGIMQFYPETAGKRFRISCHLPVTEFKMTSSLILFGFLSLTTLWLVDTAVVYIVASTYFPSEISSQTYVIMFYWYMAAVAVYAYASILTLEPSWVYKGIFGVILATPIILVKVITFYPETIYLSMVAVLAAIYMLVVYYPALRFRTGE